MSDAAVKYEADEARDAAYSTPLAEIDVADPLLFKNNTICPSFERLRSEAPVHFCETNEEAGPYWSVTRYKDIMAVDTNHQVFSSEGGITLRDQDEDFKLPMFIAMDPPKHDEQRKVVQPMFTPQNLADLEPVIRERAGQILDELPRGETFNWVRAVSVELTGRTLATLFNVPQEDRHKLIHWSDTVERIGDPEYFETPEDAFKELWNCWEYFDGVWKDRLENPGSDLISMLAHGE